MPGSNPGGDESPRPNKAIGESPADVVTDGGRDIDPPAENERHVYLSLEEFQKFSRGVPIERSTDGLELTVFPPERAVLDELDRSVAKVVRKAETVTIPALDPEESV